LLAAEQLFQQGQAAPALELYQRALDLADGDFKRSYVQGDRAWALQWLGRFEEAIAALREGLRLAEACGWEEYIEDYQLQLARLNCHLGRFSLAQPYFQELLARFAARGAEQARFRESQNMGMALMEQGRYGEALQVFEDAAKFFDARGTSQEQALAHMQLAQIHSYLGMSSRGKNEMKAAEALMGQEDQSKLRPIWNLLTGRFEMAQGQLAGAFQRFEEAAEGFERLQDINGRVEVMLALTGPLLELKLVREAQNLLDQMGDWQELRQYPALEHSVRLRRLAVAAFTGRDIQQDLDLVRNENLGIGRAEDWLSFWLHMSLAARKLGQPQVMKEFLRKARRVADQIYSGLNEEQGKFFLRRPDIARLWRLTEPTPSEAQKVRPERQSGSSGPAEPGIFAPPKKGK